MADNDNVRERIISSVFNKRNTAGQQETYVGHLKIWEDAGDGVKPRYIIISHANNVSGFIHKSKVNTNGSFSVGKTWNLSELRGIEVNALNISITLSRTYRWRTENQTDLLQLVNGLIRTFRIVAGGSPLRLIGIQDPDIPASRQLNGSWNDSRAQNSGFGDSVGTTVPPVRRSRSGSVTRSASPGPPSGFSAIPPSRFQQTGRSSSPVANGTVSSLSKLQSISRPGTPSREPVSKTPQGTSSGAARITGASRSVTPDVPQPVRGLALPPSINERTSETSQTTSVYPTVSTSLASRQARVPSNTSAPGLPQASNTSSFLPSRPSLGGESSRATGPQSSFPLKLAPLTIGSSSRSQATLSVGSSMQPHSRSVSPVPASPARSPASGRSPVSQSALLSAHGPTHSAESLAPYSPSSARASPSGLSSGLPSTLVTSLPPRAVDSAQSRNARISFFDPGNQTVLDRLVANDSMELDGMDGEDETAQATLSSVEEMLEGYELATDDILGRKGSTGTTEQIEARLLGELSALEKANIHSFIESDDRIGVVIKYLEQSITELDSMDSYVSSYKIHLNQVADDISYIQSQNRGLQVQTQNQRALVSELEQLLQTVHVDRDVLVTLTQESLEKSKSIQKLEEAAAELYKALQAGRDRDIAATMERLGEYRTYNAQFCKRMLDYLSIMFTAQSKMLIGDGNGIQKGSGKHTYSMTDHKSFEKYLGRYSGLILYLKEMDEGIYGKLCASYFSASSELHNTQMQALLKVYMDALKKTPEEDVDQIFAGTSTAGAPKSSTGMRRAGTVRSPLAYKDKDKQADGDLPGPEALSYILEALAPQIYGEKTFLADFLQINDAALTFADYMGLENYFRRQAMRSAGLSQVTQRLVRGAMDLIFGFLPAALKTWIDGAIATDKLGVIGILASIEQFMSRADERENDYLFTLLEKHHARLKGAFDRHINEQIKIVEDTKVTSKKRKGVVSFIKYFPVYVDRVESHLIGADSLEIRQNVDAAYEKIVQSMFDCLKHMAKLDGEGEDKGQLNYHVILIENMHHFVGEIAQLEIRFVTTFMKRAEDIYNENLNAYVKLVLRRPFLKILDYFEGVERLLKTTAPTEVVSNNSYNKSSFKKVVKEFTARDVRKHVDALFKRVEKHFTEASDTTTQQESGPIAQGTVMVGVWKACEEELVRITELFQKRISQCYVNTGVSLEYSTADVEGAFRKHKISG